MPPPHGMPTRSNGPSHRSTITKPARTAIAAGTTWPSVIPSRHEPHEAPLVPRIGGGRAYHRSARPRPSLPPLLRPVFGRPVPRRMDDAQDRHHAIELGSAHVCTPVSNAPVVGHLMLEKEKPEKE